jgi:hypothetical protein
MNWNESIGGLQLKRSVGDGVAAEAQKPALRL